jgi:transposase
MELDPAKVAQWPPDAIEFIKGLMARIERLEARVLELETENAELKRQLGMNSSNSSKPPSTDGLTKPNRPERREGSGKRTGKSGRGGKTRTDFGIPDEVEPVRAPECPDCHIPLDAPGVIYEKRQVAELVAKPFKVTEYQFFRVPCPCCGKEVEAPVPNHILPGFSLGPNLVGFIGLLDHYGNVTSNKMATILSEGFGLPISEGTLDKANHWLHSALAAPVAELKEVLPHLDHVHGDETGWRVDGVRCWAWALATEEISFLHIAASRGSKVLKGLLTSAFAGIISCDFYNAYRAQDGVKGKRSFCWSHLDREAEGLITANAGANREFGRALRRFIARGYRHWRGLKRGRIDVPLFQLLGGRLKEEIRAAVLMCQEVMTGKAKTLCKRLIEHLDGYLIWYDHPGIPPDNNLAERTVRPSVTQRKVSGGNRSDWGAELTAYMQTVIGTCRKQGLHIMESLRAYLLALAHPGLSYPTLVPASLSQ